MRFSPCCYCCAQARFHPGDGDLHRFACLAIVPNFTRSSGRTGAVYLCITGLSPKVSNDGKQQLPENQVCPLKPASLCSGRQITVLRYNTLGTAAVSVSPDDCTKVRSPISLCNRSKCCLPSMMCSLGLEVVTEFYLLYIAPKPNQIMQCKARQPRGSSGTHRSSVCMACVACDAYAICY